MNGVNMRTHEKSDKQIEEDVQYEKAYLDHKKDMEIRVGISEDTFYRCRVKTNLALFGTQNTSYELTDEMIALAGEEENFEMVVTTATTDGVFACGFGYSWDLDWLEKLEFLAAR